MTRRPAAAPTCTWGGCFSYRTPPGGVLTFAGFPEARAGAPGPGNTPQFVNTGPIAALDVHLFDLEAAWVAGPLSVQAELVYAPVRQVNGPDLHFHGGYAYVSYFLTGEHRPYNKRTGAHDRVVPFENFFHVRACDGRVLTGRGAWEVAARCSYLDLTDGNVQGGVQRNVTLGLNWHLNPHTRMKWEYILADLDRPPVGRSTAHIVGMRFDIDF